MSLLYIWWDLPITDVCTAIEYIARCQQNERTYNSELQRLQRDSDIGREVQKENDMLKTEIQVMHQTLRRLDPNAPHVYGHFSSQLSHGASGPPPPQTNGASNGINLPPINGGAPGAAHGYGGPPPAAPMQGVEYGYNGR